MTKQDIPNHQVDMQKPYETFACAGRYMEVGARWTAIPNLCSSECEMRFACWLERNPEEKAKYRIVQDQPAASATDQPATSAADQK